MDKQQDALRKLGRRLAQLRQQQDLTLAQLATRTGIDSRELASIEAGEKDLRITTIFAICRGLGLPPGEWLDIK